jgi:D-alanine-D-alanine ligase
MTMDFVETRTTLVVLYGGQSAEHDVSCVTAAHVLRAVDHSAYRTVPIAISREGIWYLPKMAQLAEGGVDPKSIPDQLVASGEQTSMAVITALSTTASTVVMPLLHGPLGEDGTIQGLLELLDMPYVGSAVLASAVAMDKGMSKTIFAQVGIPQVRHLTLREDLITPESLDQAAVMLGFPMFVKPANMGSSVGVSKAHDADELRTACALACQYDQWVICEEAVTAREIEVAVIGNRTPEASVVGEIIPANEFYDYEDKYVTDAATLNIPAHLTSEQSNEVRALAIKAYEALRCEGMARVDFFFEENGRGFLCNEINTIPGFTPISMYPKLWGASGLSYTDLIDQLIGHALERHDRRKRNTAR